MSGSWQYFSCHFLSTVYTQYIEMHSDIVISQSDGRPMYLQIIEQIKQRIAVGEWVRGEEIPSIRQLAVALKVSVITVKRAYLELERERVIFTQHGKGSIVAPDPGLGQRLYDEELAEHIEQAARLGALLGLGPEELALRLQEATDQFMAGRLAVSGASAARITKERI
jgi:GntR family transcriptional regulator